MRLNEQKPGRKSHYTPEQKALLAKAARRRATRRPVAKKRVAESTYDRIKRLEASVSKYLRDNMQAALDRAAREIAREDARAIDAAGREPVKPARATRGPLTSDAFLSELYSV